jgi:hypothetical protein
MIRKILLLLFSLIIISVAFNYYIEKKLSTAFSEIEPENLQYLEHHSNINFYTHGLENIGENLQHELLKMDMHNCKLEVRRDYVYFFQNKAVNISNDKKCLRIDVDYKFVTSVFSIIGFQTCN